MSLEYKEYRNIQQQFFRKLGDLCWIFWTDYKRRLGLEEFPIATADVFEDGKWKEKEFNLERAIVWFGDQTIYRISPTELFKKAVSTPFNRHVVYPQVNQAINLRGLSSTPDFLQRTIEEAEDLRVALPEQLRQSRLSTEISGGFGSGVGTITQFYLLSRVFPAITGFERTSLIMLTKVAFEHLDEAQVGIGIQTADYIGDRTTPFDLIQLQNPLTGLNQTKLRELGYGLGLGCPSRYKPSAECRDYLQTKFGVNPEGEVLFDIRQQLLPAIVRLLIDPFRVVDQKYPGITSRIKEHERSLLLGQVPQILPS